MKIINIKKSEVSNIVKRCPLKKRKRGTGCSICKHNAKAEDYGVLLRIWCEKEEPR